MHKFDGECFGGSAAKDVRKPPQVSTAGSKPTTVHVAANDHGTGRVRLCWKRFSRIGAKATAWRRRAPIEDRHTQDECNHRQQQRWPYGPPQSRHRPDLCGAVATAEMVVSVDGFKVNRKNAHLCFSVSIFCQLPSIGRVVVGTAPPYRSAAVGI